LSVSGNDVTPFDDSFGQTNELLFRRNKKLHVPQEAHVQEISHVDYVSRHTTPPNFVESQENMLNQQRHYTISGERPTEGSVGFQKETHLVMGMNSMKRNPVKRKICIPSRRLLPVDDFIVDVR
jgi:hypothetical protein